MGLPPLPHLNTDFNTPGALDNYQKGLTLQSLLSGQKTQQLQQQGLEQENQMRGLQLQDQQTLRSLSPQFVKKDSDGNVTGYDSRGFFNKAAGAGVSPQTLNQLQIQQLELTKNYASADEAARNNEMAKNKAAYELLEGVRAEPDVAKRPSILQQGMANLQHLGFDPSRLPQNMQFDDQSLSNIEAGLGMHAQALSDAKTVAETNQAAQRANLAKMEAAQKGSPLLAMETNPAEMAGEKLPAAMGYLQSKIADQATTPEDKARATRLLSTAKTTQQIQLQMEASKKAADQAIQDGDPVIAGKLLHDGLVAPSQIISSRKPEFAQKAFSAATSYGDGWNAQKAEADFKVASSPANVAFFGSAKSLTDKGGTLDQLAEAAKDIPQGKIPVFNSIADAMKAATGDGPIAKYASILLGVSDDYSKVMGGGNGSDSSRTQALHLAPTNASPEARAGAIEGIRGSVTSQTNSRIGNNAVLQKMYGGGGQARTRSAPPAGATMKVPGSDGKLHYSDGKRDLGVVE